MCRIPTQRLTILLLLLTALGAAQELRPPWHALPDNLPPGVAAYEASLEGPVRAFAVTVDLQDDGIEFRPIVSAEKAGKERLTSLARRTGAVVAVNASFFDLNSERCRIVGWTMLDGRSLTEPIAEVTQRNLRYPVARAALVWTDGGVMRLYWAGRRGGTTVLLDHPLPNRTGAPAGLPEDGVEAHGVLHAVGAGPMLLRDGRTAITREEERMFVSEDVRHPRTAVGLQGRKVILLLADGRCPESTGLTLQELALLLQRLGARDAMNLDGGGSSTLVIGGRLVNRPCGGTVERPIPCGLGVFRRGAESEKGRGR